MKVLNLVLAVMFLAFAFLQVNDPDPVLWILIYGLMAVVCILAAFNTYYKVAMIVLLVGYSVYCFFLIPGFQEWMAQEDKSVLLDDVMKMQYPYIEETREFLGLLICIIVLVLQLVRSRYIKKPA